MWTFRYAAFVWSVEPTHQSIEKIGGKQPLQERSLPGGGGDQIMWLGTGRGQGMRQGRMNRLRAEPVAVLRPLAGQPGDLASVVCSMHGIFEIDMFLDLRQRIGGEARGDRARPDPADMDAAARKLHAQRPGP